jgi:hypothetical protein
MSQQSPTTTPNTGFAAAAAAAAATTTTTTTQQQPQQPQHTATSVASPTTRTRTSTPSSSLQNSPHQPVLQPSNPHKIEDNAGTNAADKRSFWQKYKKGIISLLVTALIVGLVVGLPFAFPAVPFLLAPLVEVLTGAFAFAGAYAGMAAFAASVTAAAVATFALIRGTAEIVSCVLNRKTKNATSEADFRLEEGATEVLESGSKKRGCFDRLLGKSGPEIDRAAGFGNNRENAAPYHRSNPANAAPGRPQQQFRRNELDAATAGAGANARFGTGGL